MHELSPLIKDLAIMLCLGSIAILICQKLRQPIVLGYLIAGIIMGPYTPPHTFVKDITNIKALSELGVIFLIFSLGLDFSFRKLSRVGFSASITGGLEVFLMTGVGFITGQLLGWTFYDALFLGAALSISSTTIIIKAIDELGLRKRKFAEIIFGILIVEDLLAILLLAILSTLIATHHFFSAEIIIATGKLALVVCSWFIIGYFLIPTLVRKINNYATDETITLVSLGLCLFMVCIAAYFNYSAALGAFIMGSILAETPAIHRIVHLIKPVKDIFAAVFFITVGMLINPLTMIQEWPTILILTLITIFGKLITTALGALLTGQSLGNALRIGLAMAQVGEFSFIIISLGLASKVLDKDIYSIIVAVSGITTFTTPYLIRFSSYATTSINNLFSHRTKYLLGNYAAHVHHWAHSDQPNFFKKTRMRLIINGIVVAVIFTMSYKFLLPKTMEMTESLWFAKTFCWLMAMLLSSPFLWGILFSSRNSQRVKNKTYLNVTQFLVWTVTITGISILSVVYFQTWLIVVLLFITFVSFFTFAYRHLEKAYQWFEEQLVENIKKEDEHESKYRELIAWDSYLVEVEVHQHAAFSGKRLNECRPLQVFGINILAIYRDNKSILAPSGEEKILPHDKLIILGSEEKIDQFRKKIETTTKITKEPEENRLIHFGLRSILLTKLHPWIGRRIGETKFRKEMEGILVGIERSGSRLLNPPVDTILQLDDIVLIAGETDALNKIP